MRLHVLSDLHLRYASFQPPAVPADVVILAGDIDRGTRGVAWASEKFGDRPVLYVPGNHEYYEGELDAVDAACHARAAAGPGQVKVLQNEEWVLDDVVFLGATLWTDFCLFGNHTQRDAMRKIEAKAPDFRLISVREGEAAARTIRPEDLFHRFDRSLTWINRRLRQHHMAGLRTCVITHFAPSRGSLACRFADDLSSAYFVNALDDWLADAGPDLWIHGHVHDGFDYRIGGTRVVCNPRGYPGERDQTDSIPFNPELLIEL